MKDNLYVAIFNFICCLISAMFGNTGWAFVNLIFGFINLAIYYDRRY